MCVHNAGRSQLAAGLAAQRAGDRMVVRSAGFAPDPRVSQPVLDSLAEVGIDRSRELPRRITTALVEQSDVVISLKPDLPVPHVPGVRYETWSLPDPAEWDIAGLRPLREHLATRIDGLVAELVADLGSSLGRRAWISERGSVDPQPGACEPGMVVGADCVGTTRVTPLSWERAQHLSSILTAISEPTGVRIMSMIASADGSAVCLCDLARELDLPELELREHLDRLRAVGAVRSHARDGWTYFTARPESFVSLGRAFQTDAGVGHAPD